MPLTRVVLAQEPCIALADFTNVIPFRWTMWNMVRTIDALSSLRHAIQRHPLPAHTKQ